MASPKSRSRVSSINSVVINLDHLLFVAYENTYRLLTQVLFENLKERPSSCVSFDPVDYCNYSVG
jgi:hypothetical protein